MNFDELIAGIETDDGQAGRHSDGQASVALAVSEDWLQGRTVYGGLQGAIAVLAMRQLVAAELPLRSLQVTFIAPVPAGRVEARAELLRRGRSATQVEARIHGEAGICLVAVGIFGAERESAAEHLPTAPPCERSVDDAMQIEYVPGMMPAFMQHIDTRAAEGRPPFSGTRHSTGKIYSRLKDVPISSDAHLVAFADVAPPVVLAQLTQPAPASSMNWQLELTQTSGALHEVDWFRVDAEVSASHNGYCWQSSTIWSDRGELVALSRQCMAIFG